MEILLVIFSATVGAVVGSFLNVVILRSPRGETLGGRSRCESCRKNLGALELIPILSFVIQRGRCRSCGSRLFWQEPVVEFATALSFGLTARFLPNLMPAANIAVMLPTAFLVISALVVIVVSDLKYYLIPDGPILPLLAVGVIFSLARGAYVSWAITAYDFGLAFVVAAVPALLWLVSKGRWMGLGDAKLFLVLSLLVGFPHALVSFLFSFWAGGLWGILLISIGKKSLGERLAFAPFIVIGAIGSILWGQKFLAATGISAFLDFMLYLKI